MASSSVPPWPWPPSGSRSASSALGSLEARSWLKLRRQPRCWRSRASTLSWRRCRSSSRTPTVSCRAGRSARTPASPSRISRLRSPTRPPERYANLEPQSNRLGPRTNRSVTHASAPCLGQAGDFGRMADHLMGGRPRRARTLLESAQPSAGRAGTGARLRHSRVVTHA